MGGATGVVVREAGGVSADRSQKRLIALALPVRLEAVAGDLQLLTELSYAFINRETGETILLSEEELGFVDQDPETLSEWQRDAVPKIREVRESASWLQLPTQWDIHEYRFMERFCHSVDEETARGQLLRAIRGRGAFRLFRDRVEQLGLLESWYAYRDRAYEEFTAAWLEAHEIPFVREGEAQQ